MPRAAISWTSWCTAGSRFPERCTGHSESEIVVEVLSPGNAIKDLRDKLQGYFLVASIQHYLVVDPDKGLGLDVVHQLANRAVDRLHAPEMGDLGSVTANIGDHPEKLLDAHVATGLF